MRTGSGKRNQRSATLLVLGFLATGTACANNVAGSDICAAQRQYAVICPQTTTYIDATCQHDAACEFNMYRDELILTKHQCVLQNVAAMNCNPSSCDQLTTAQQVITQTAQLGPLANAFSQSCVAKLNECGTATMTTPDVSACFPSPVCLDQVFAGVVACENVSCDQYGACVLGVLTQNVGQGCPVANCFI